MAQPDPQRPFPSEDSLCESCGYPLRSLSILADCPECGLAVVESSPIKRSHQAGSPRWPFEALFTVAPKVLFSPGRFFRSMPVRGSRRHAWQYLYESAIFAGLIWFLTGYQAIGLWRFPGILSWLIVIWGVWLLTYIEMLGVVTFSRRRGWRVPWPLAKRVCSYASVGWLPGMLLAGGGAWVLKFTALGEPWFESLLGLVRVSWLFYGGLFVVSLLWFETLVWVGVRQVRFANRWPAASEPATRSGPNAASGIASEPLSETAQKSAANDVE